MWNCACLYTCVLKVKLHSLSQSDKGEDGDVVAHTNDKDEPQGKGEVFYVSQLDHLTWKWKHTFSSCVRKLTGSLTNEQTSPKRKSYTTINKKTELECRFLVDKNRNGAVVADSNFVNHKHLLTGEAEKGKKQKIRGELYLGVYLFFLLPYGGSFQLFCQETPTPGHR